MRCQKMELGEPDASGRRRPVPVDGLGFHCRRGHGDLRAGHQRQPDHRPDHARASQINKWGYIEVDEKTGMTSIPGRVRGRRHRHRRGHRDPGHGRRAPRRARHAGIPGNCRREARSEEPSNAVILSEMPRGPGRRRDLLRAGALHLAVQELPQAHHAASPCRTASAFCAAANWRWWRAANWATPCASRPFATPCSSS